MNGYAIQTDYKKNLENKPWPIEKCRETGSLCCEIVEHGGSLTDSSPFVRRVAGSNPALFIM